MWASSGAERLTSINGITSAKVIGREMSAEVSARSGKPIQLATSINKCRQKREYRFDDEYCHFCERHGCAPQLEFSGSTYVYCKSP